MSSIVKSNIQLLKNVLSTDSISTTRLTINSNVQLLSAAIVDIINQLGGAGNVFDSGPNLSVNNISANFIVANGYALPLLPPYLFSVNINGDIISKSLVVSNVIETPRLRLDPNPNRRAFQAGEVRWSGALDPLQPNEFLGFNGIEWINFGGGGSGTVINGANTVPDSPGTLAGVFYDMIVDSPGTELIFKTLQAGAGISFSTPSSPDETIIINSGVRYDIPTGGGDPATVLNPVGYEYLLYGDLTLEVGSSFVNHGKLVILNGAIVNLGGSVVNFGSIEEIDLAFGPAAESKFRMAFTTVANTPLTITHNLNTLDFTYAVRSGNDDVIVELVRVDVNNVTIQTTVAVTGSITIIG